MLTRRDDVLTTVRRHGWSRERRQAFLRQYGSLLRRALLSELGKRFGARAIYGLRDYLKALEQGQRPDSGDLSGRFLELAQNVWQAVCLEIFKEDRNTIAQYDAYRDKCGQQGRRPMPFKGYLWGLVSLKVRQQIPRHRQAFDPVRSPPDDATDPADAWEERLAGAADAEADAIALSDDVDRFWEGLVTCDSPHPDEVARALSLEDRDEHRLCWACSSLKHRLSPAKRENLVAFVAFVVSQRGPERKDGALPEPGQLSLGDLTGRYLRWEADVCAQIFGKSIRKDRIIEQIQAELERLTRSEPSHPTDRSEAGWTSSS